MEVTKKSRRQVRLQNITFVVLLLAIVGVLAWLSTRYHYQADWTASGRNTLSESSRLLLKKIDGPVAITAFVRDTPALRKSITEMLARYQRYKHNVTLTFVNPDLEPQRVRELGVTREGELVIEYQGRSEKIADLTEEALTNALQRLARSGERWLVFLDGHGERNPLGQANHDLGSWGHELENKGINIQSINLANNQQIPDNTTVLVIADPQVDLFPGEIAAVQDYVKRGGNLLWLAEPGSLHGLEPLATQVGVRFLPGMVVDPTGRLFGISNPTFTVVADYPAHPITRDFNVITLFPSSAGIKLTGNDRWNAQEFLRTTGNTWVETGKLAGAIRFDDGVDIRGPVTIGAGLTRDKPDVDGSGDKAAKNSSDKPDNTGNKKAVQRIVVIGDSDFLANAYLGNGGNLDLGMNIVNWLASDDAFISIPVKTATDLTLELSDTLKFIIGAGFLVVLPIVLLGSGMTIWWRRRKR